MGDPFVSTGQKLEFRRAPKNDGFRATLLFRAPTREFCFFVETSNGRLPPEQSSDRPETLAKHVSDDLQLFIFRRRKKFLDEIFAKIFGVDFFFQENEVLEGL